MSEIKPAAASGGLPKAGMPPSAAVTPAPVPAASPPTPPAPIEAPVISLGGTLAQLPAGSRLSGVVIGQDDTGRPILATAQGSYAVDAEMALPQNTRLLLQIVASASGMRALILVQDSHALQPPPEVGLTALTGSADTARAAAPLPATRVEHTRLSGIILAEAQRLPAAITGTASPAPSPPPLPQGTALTVQIIEVQTAAASPVIQAPQSPSAGATGAVDAAAANLSPALLAQALKEIYPQPVSGGEPGKAIVEAVPGRILAGIVVGENGGRLLVQSEIGLIGLDAGSGIPRGSRLVMEIRSLAPAVPPAGEQMPTTANAPLQALARDWPALRQIVDLLQQIDPALTQSLAERVLPRPDAQLASNLLFFLAALRGGDARSWFGKDAVGRLSAGGGDAALDQLDRDFADINRLEREPGSGAWRATPLPIFDGRAILPVMLFSRQQHRKAEDDGADGSGGRQDDRRGTASRFVVELALTATGPLQLDGLLRAKSLNLILRSRRPLAASAQRDIRGIFDDTLAATGCSGSLAYQVTQRFPVMPMQEMATRARTAPIIV